MGYRESEPDYLLKHKEILFKQLLEMTKDFPFKPREEPKEAPQEAQLKNLINFVRYTAIKLCRQTPVQVRVAEDQDDWIQAAFEIFCKESREYQPTLCYYDVHMKARVLVRLRDRQRSAYRTNPADDAKRRKTVAEIGRQIPREVTVQEVAIFAGINTEEAQVSLDSTPRRMFEEWSDKRDLHVFLKDDDGTPSFSPEKACLMKENSMVLLKCLEKLEPYQRGIVIERFLEGKKFEDITARFGARTVEATRSQARRGFNALRECVLKQPPIGLPA